MPEPLSKDIRQRIIAAKKQGDSHSKIAREMRVSVSTVTRLLTLYRATGDCEPRAMHLGRKPRLDEEMLQKIREKIEQQPDIKLQELIDEFSLPVSTSALCKTINKKLGLIRKKTSSNKRVVPSEDSTKTAANKENNQRVEQ